MGELFGTYFTRGSMGLVMSQDAMSICSLEMMGLFNVVEHCSLSRWLIFADVIFLLHLRGSFMLITLTSPTLPYAYEQNTEIYFSRPVVSRLLCFLIVINATHLKF